jgi:hypothetical protein
MRRLLIVASVLGIFAAVSFSAFADEQFDASSAPVKKSALAADGELQKLREPLAQIFQFKLDGGNLKFDRAAWESAAAEIEKKNSAAKEAEQLPPGMDPESPAGLRFRARLLQEKATQLERQQRIGALPPFITLVQNIEEQSHHGQRATGGATGFSTNGKFKSVRRTFAGATLIGEARSDNDGDMFAIRETELPNRTLELSVENDNGFRIELFDKIGNAIFLRQRPSSFSIISLIDGHVETITGRSFIDAYRRNRTRMDNILPILVQIGFAPVLSPGEPQGEEIKSNSDVAWSDSPLLAQGELLEYKGPVANIFKFNLVDGRLRIDLDVWKQRAEEIKKEFAEAAETAKAQAEQVRQNPQAAMQLQQALIMRQLLLRSSLTPPPPLVFIFEKIKEQAQRSSRGFGSGGPSGSGSGDRMHWQSTFAGDVFSGSLNMTNDSENIVLQEAQSPRRQLEIHLEATATFEVKLTNREGDVISLRQERGGNFIMLAMIGDAIFADQRDSFAAFVRANRRVVSNEILPALSQIGFEPILPPDSPGVRHAVVASLLSANEIQAEGKRLIADLNSDDYDTRERASQSLTARYDLYKELVQAALDNPSNSPEVQARLNALVQPSHSVLQPIDTATALDLAHDPSYIKSLLDETHAEIRPRLAEQLEKVTHP